MKQKRRILSLLIALVMVIALVPASVFAADDTRAVSTASVDIIAQLSGGFVIPPQFGVSVSSDLAENYGYTDSVEDGVSVLDVLVKAHEIAFEDAFTPETAETYLKMSSGSPTMQFGVGSDVAYGGFFLNRAMANDGTESSWGGWNGTLVGTQKVVDGDLVDFFFYEDEYYGDTYNWFEDASGYSREFTVDAGEDLELTLKGFYAGSAYMFKDAEEMIASDSAYEVADAQICTVDLATGTLTPIEDAITDEEGAVTLNFEEAGTYTIAAASTDDSLYLQLLTLTTITVEGEEPEPTTASVDIIAQLSGAFIIPPQFGVSVSSDLAESYGYTDSVEDGVSVLDVLVKAHELAFEDAFTPETAQTYLKVPAGSPTMQFGVDSDQAYGGFFLNRAMANDGTESSWGGWNGTLVGTQKVVDGDLVDFFFYEDEYYGDTYNWFEDASGYSREFTVDAGEDLELTLKGFYASSAYMFKDAEEMIASDSAYEVADAQICTVDLETGEVTAIEDAITDEEGAVTLNFEEAGTYTIAAATTEDSLYLQLLTLTTITVKGEDEPADPIDINVTIVNKGEVIVPAEALTVEDVDGDGTITTYDALYSAHEEWFEGGAAAGFAVDGGWMNKFWGDTSGAFMYYVNHAAASGLTQDMADGDYLVAYVFKDQDTWTDAYAKLTGETDDEGVVTLTLEKEDWEAGGFAKIAEAEIVVYDSDFQPLDDDAYTVTDNGDGTYTVELAETGDYIFVAYKDPLVPPVYRESVTVPEGSGEEHEKNDLEKIYKETGDALSEFTYEAGMEWMALGLARAGREVPGVEDYLASLEDYINEKANENEQLAASKSSDNSRIILALTALAQDATKFADHDLIKGLSDLTYVGKQGLNGYSWALLALDCHEYEEAEGATATRDALVKALVTAQHDDGGWSLSSIYPNSDGDITAMVLQALAPYYSENADVKAAVDKALTWLSGAQNEYGAFGSVDGASVESCAQVVVALTALGIDPHTDERFVKGEWSLMDALTSYYLGDGQFCHTLGGKYDGTATEQAYYAMASYFRFKDGQTSLYDMTDVEFEEESETPEGPIVKITDKDKAEVSFEYEEVAEDIKLTKQIAADVNDKIDDPNDVEIIWQKDVVVPEGTAFPADVEFKVDKKYKDQEIFIYHYNAEKKAWEVVGEGKYETFTVAFDSLSPVAMVAKAATEAPNTGDASQMLLWAAMFAVAAAGGAATVVTGRKRKED